MGDEQLRDITSLLIALRKDNSRHSASIDRLTDALAELTSEFAELRRQISEFWAEGEADNDTWGLWSDQSG